MGGVFTGEPDDPRGSTLSARPIRADGAYVLYWMIAARRTRWSPALDRALRLARGLGKPLLVLEPLRIGYPWASPRFHRFIVEGMVDQADAFGRAGVTYHAYVERAEGEGRGLVRALAAGACAVVTDDHPCAFLPRMARAGAEQSPVRVEAIDGDGVVPRSQVPRAFPTAAGFRRHLQRTLPAALACPPSADPLAGYDLGRAMLPDGVAERWPHAADLLVNPGAVSRLGLAGPGAVPFAGGSRAAERVVSRFLAEALPRYDDRKHPDAGVESGLSPYLHFGQVSAHEVVSRVLDAEGWSEDRLGAVTGSREGWWGVSDAAEAFLDELVTWRELGFAFCHHEPRYDAFDTLPPWARATLHKHAADPRPVVYDRDTLAAAATGDPLWNAAQRQLLAEGRIHNALRMLWGKRVLGWSATPELGWHTLIDLNNRFAIDGRDPNSYSGIAWTFGRFDRAWGPERPIYGTVRYLSSENTRKKLRLNGWLTRWGR